MIRKGNGGSFLDRYKGLPSTLTRRDIARIVVAAGAAFAAGGAVLATAGHGDRTEHILVAWLATVAIFAATIVILGRADRIASSRARESWERLLRRVCRLAVRPVRRLEE